MKEWKEFIGHCDNETHVEHKGDNIDIDTFSYKGCWACQYFTLNSDHYMYTRDASKKYDVSEGTIRRWCREGKLDARLCVRERYEGNRLFLASNKIWIIKKVI